MIRDGRAYLLRRNARTDQEYRAKLGAEQPALAVAYEANARRFTDPGVAFLFESRLLARQISEEIAGMAGTSPEAVDYYEGLYFNVRDRFDNRDWAFQKVLVPAIVQEYGKGVANRGISWGMVRPFYDATVKLFAYFGGPHAVDLLVYGGFDPKAMPHSTEETAGWLDGVWASAVRSRSARAMLLQHVGFENVGVLFSLHSQLVTAARVNCGHDGGTMAYAEIVGALLTSTPFATGALAEAHRKPIDVNSGPWEARAHEKVLAGLGQPVTLPTGSPRP